MNNSKFAIASTKTRKNKQDLLLSIFPLGHIFNAFLVILAMTLISQVNANELATLSSTSYGVLAQTIDDNSRATIIEQNNAILVSDQLSGKASGKTRDEILATQSLTAISPQARSLALHYAPEFSIYNATTLLQNDFDRDGFYQTVSVTFDPDMYSYDGDDFATVYARLYLSKNGGPWIHYYSSDNFIIHGNSDQDTYEVITTFRDGYAPGYYDILIDLYQVGYYGIVATYSANDNAALYALPIESRDYDGVYVDHTYPRHGGSFSVWSLLLMLLVLTWRLTARFSSK